MVTCYWEKLSLSERGVVDMAIAVEPSPVQTKSYAPYRVNVQEYVTFHEQGYLVVRGLVPLNDVQELRDHTDAILSVREAIPKLGTQPTHRTPEEQLTHLLRIHMLHRILPIHECFLLH